MNAAPALAALKAELDDLKAERSLCDQIDSWPKVQREHARIDALIANVKSQIAALEGTPS